MTVDPPPVPGTPRGRGDLSMQVLTLAAEVAGLRARVDELDVEHLREHLTALTETVTGLISKSAPAAPATIICWADMDAGARGEAIGLVRDWMHDVLFVWHPESRKAMRPCWYRHRDVLSDTAALYEVWSWAYRDPEAPPGRREEWHASWLPDWIERMKTAGHRGCVDAHDARPTPEVGPEWNRGFDEYAAWFADAQGHPEPTSTDGVDVGIERPLNNYPTG